MDEALEQEQTPRQIQKPKGFLTRFEEALDRDLAFVENELDEDINRMI